MPNTVWLALVRWVSVLSAAACHLGCEPQRPGAPATVGPGKPMVLLQAMVDASETQYVQARSTAVAGASAGIEDYRMLVTTGRDWRCRLAAAIVVERVEQAKAIRAVTSRTFAPPEQRTLSMAYNCQKAAGDIAKACRAVPFLVAESFWKGNELRLPYPAHRDARVTGAYALSILRPPHALRLLGLGLSDTDELVREHCACAMDRFDAIDDEAVGDLLRFLDSRVGTGENGWKRGDTDVVLLVLQKVKRHHVPILQEWQRKTNNPRLKEVLAKQLSRYHTEGPASK